jgi:putative transposase
VARLAWQAGIKAQVGYKRRPDSYCGTPSVVIDNTLDRQFAVSASDAAWVTDTTFIRTHEGFAYLSVVIDLYSRRWLVGRYKVGRPLIWSARHC